MSRRDGTLAIGYYVYLTILTTFFGFILYRTTFMHELLKDETASYHGLRIIVSFPMLLLQLVPIFVILRLRGQSLSSIGITKTKLIRSVMIGIIAAIPLSAVPIYAYLIGVARFQQSFGDILLQLAYYLILVAFAEEVMFRGYIQTRVQGLIANKLAAILVVSVMFSILHIPLQIIRFGQNPVDYIAEDWFSLLLKGLMHPVFVFLYSRTDNVIAPTVTHGLFDYLLS